MSNNRIPSLAEVAVINLRHSGRTRVRAMVDAAQMCSLIWAWAKTTRDLGREPTRYEHCQHWGQRERTLYLELAKFRQAFPTERDPQRLANWLNAEHYDLADAAVMALPAPDLVLVS
jgi:hypothetical protein